MAFEPIKKVQNKTVLIGQELLKRIARLIQIAKLYEDNNKLVVEAVEDFTQIVRKSSEGEPQTSLRIINGRFFIQTEKLPLLRKNAKLFNQMLRFFETRTIYGLHFNSDLTDIAAADILLFFQLLNLAGQQSSPSQWLTLQLEQKELHWLAVIEDVNQTANLNTLETTFLESDALERKKEAAQKTYHYALNSIQEVADKLLSKKDASIRKTVRMVQGMVDIIMEDDTTFMALSTIRMYDDYTFTHSLNVALLAMSLGKRIGMSHKNLEKLGLSSLFHDLGKLEVPKNILNKRGKLNDAEFEEMKKHSLYSALLILKLKTDKYRKVHLFVAPFEHHIRYDHSGYPSIDKKRPVSLFGRIITIADVYDAITSPRIYRPTSMSPSKALGLMLQDSGKHFDPVLLKVFANMLGVFPIGTLLILNTGEFGLALGRSQTSDQTRPMVQLLQPSKDDSFVKGDIIDLAERNARTGTYKREVIKTQHPAALGIQPASFIL